MKQVKQLYGGMNFVQKSFYALTFACMLALPIVGGVSYFTEKAHAADSFSKLTSVERGELAAAAITGNSLGAAVTVLTTLRPSVQFWITNTCAVEMMVVMNGANFKRIPASTTYAFDLKSDEIYFAPTTYKVYYTGSAPASCNFEIISAQAR